MSVTRQLTVTLPSEVADAIEQRVASGAYPTEGDVIASGLRALSEEEALEDDPAFRAWVREKIAPVLAATRADPSRSVPGDQARAELAARWAVRGSTAQ